VTVSTPSLPPKRDTKPMPLDEIKRLVCESRGLPPPPDTARECRACQGECVLVRREDDLIVHDTCLICQGTGRVPA
jgi:DnaJ-class molecular chaperone